MPLSQLEKFIPSKQHKFVFDTNIWISACWPQYDCATKDIDNKYKKCLAFLNKCVSSNSKIFIPFVVLSEIFNRIAREECKQYNKRNKGNISFKQYRKTDEYKEIAKQIKGVFSSQIKKFADLNKIELIDDDFMTFPLENAISKLQKMDFNDLLILHLCKKTGAFLVTNDSDFFSGEEDVNIVTSLINK